MKNLLTVKTTNIIIVLFYKFKIKYEYITYNIFLKRNISLVIHQILE